MERRSNPVCITLVTERNIFRVIKIAKVINKHQKKRKRKRKRKRKSKSKLLGRQLLEKWVLRYCAQ